MEIWAKQFEDKIRLYLINDLRENGINPETPIDYSLFTKWISKDHNLMLTYANKTIIVATSLSGLDEINFIDDVQLANNFSTQSSFNSYPTFN